MDPCLLVDAALTAAVDAARAGGAVLAATDRTRVDVTHKDARVDITTSADLASQAAVVRVLREVFPEHVIVGEEGTAPGSDGRHVWYVDGLDGTSNFTHGIPWYAVSVALRCGDEVVAGAVFDPVHDELWAAGRGRGATRRSADPGGGGRAAHRPRRGAGGERGRRGRGGHERCDPRRAAGRGAAVG